MHAIRRANYVRESLETRHSRREFARRAPQVRVICDMKGVAASPETRILLAAKVGSPPLVARRNPRGNPECRGRSGSEGRVSDGI